MKHRVSGMASLLLKVLSKAPRYREGKLLQLYIYNRQLRRFRGVRDGTGRRRSDAIGGDHRLPSGVSASGASDIRGLCTHAHTASARFDARAGDYGAPAAVSPRARSKFPAALFS